MDSLNLLYGTMVLVAAALAAIAIGTPRRLALRAGAVVLSGTLMAVGYASFAELLGRPKPASLEWASAATAEATVVASDMREGKAIYLWLLKDGAEAPRAYVLPWSMQAGRALHEATAEAEAQGTKVKMRMPLDAMEDESEPVFYVSPQPPLPAKLANGG